jgi:glycosyltransferase involved in cell wall biosynthesis
MPARQEATPRRGRLLAREGLRVVGAGGADGYEGDLVGKIEEYARRCQQVVEGEEFDVIHAHDWVTFPAAMAIASRSGRPLVVHVHSTEFDRSGERVNPAVREIERLGVHAAGAVIAVSRLTKNVLVERYNLSPTKVRVVYNGIDSDGPPARRPADAGRDKVVLFLGRLTMQKGPEFFIRAAGRVLQKMDGVKFVMAGWGDLGPRAVEQAAAMGLGSSVRFAGFLRGAEVRRAYRMADVYVMPSVSEPFGLTALEAIQNGLPVVLSRSSGVAEVLPRGALKVDFWDVDEMANKIVSLLSRPEMAEDLRRQAEEEARGLTWDRAALQCLQVYHEQTGV